MSPSDLFLVTLVAVLGLALGGGVITVYLVRRGWPTRRAARQIAAGRGGAGLAPGSRFSLMPLQPAPPQRPGRWLAIRTRDTQAVQLALGLRNPQPCSWTEGLITARKLFIAPPINGWTLVFGAGLPAPDVDVDRCFCFLRELSLKFGPVQFFQADTLLQHHAWAWLESGRVVRGYAWAGTTLWQQGVKTSAEIALGLNCFGYGENPGSDDWSLADHLVTNVEKVPQLAQRWSLDPAEIDARLLGRQPGITGHGARS
jgi:hypothetical protein